MPREVRGCRGDRRCPVTLALCAGAYWGSRIATDRSVRRLPGPFPAVAAPVSTSHRVSVPTCDGYSSRSQPICVSVARMVAGTGGGVKRGGRARIRGSPGPAARGTGGSARPCSSARTGGRSCPGWSGSGASGDTRRTGRVAARSWDRQDDAAWTPQTAARPRDRLTRTVRRTWDPNPRTPSWPCASGRRVERRRVAVRGSVVAGP